MKYAIEFDIVRHENGKIDYVMGNQCIISELHYLHNIYDFACDYWEWFQDEYNTPELKDVDEIEKDYHVFSYGNFSINGGIDDYGEYDVEIIFEPEYTNIVKIK